MKKYIKIYIMLFKNTNQTPPVFGVWLTNFAWVGSAYLIDPVGKSLG